MTGGAKILRDLFLRAGLLHSERCKCHTIVLLLCLYRSTHGTLEPPHSVLKSLRGVLKGVACVALGGLITETGVGKQFCTSH